MALTCRGNAGRCRTGLVEVTFSNTGKEPAPPGGDDGRPAAFEPFAGVPAADPGVQGSNLLNLPAGTYALFCSIPHPTVRGTWPRA